jgi:hypothetical protein
MSPAQLNCLCVKQSCVDRVVTGGTCPTLAVTGAFTTTVTGTGQVQILSSTNYNCNTGTTTAALSVSAPAVSLGGSLLINGVSSATANSNVMLIEFVDTNVTFTANSIVAVNGLSQLIVRGSSSSVQLQPGVSATLRVSSSRARDPSIGLYSTPLVLPAPTGPESSTARLTVLLNSQQNLFIPYRGL